MSRLRNDGAIERARVPLRRRDGRSIQVLSSVVGVFDAASSSRPTGSSST